jgi:hypothetical protein
MSKRYSGQPGAQRNAQIKTIKGLRIVMVKKLQKKNRNTEALRFSIKVWFV